jgi:uncharacterized membrane protein
MQVNDGTTKFCPGCGAPLGQGAAQPAGEKQNFADSFRNMNNTADQTQQYEKADIDQNKVMAVLAYLGFLVLVPILAAPQSKFARFHANQGLLLAIAEIAYGIVYGILTAIFYAISFWLGALFSTLLGLVWIVFTVLVIIGIINAANGKAKELPVIGKFRILK